MKKPKISLGGKNNHGRMSGACSSRASSTTFKQLQKLDRQISKLENLLYPFGKTNVLTGGINYTSFRMVQYADFEKKLEKIKKLDLKRKEIRMKRKSYEKL